MEYILTEILKNAFRATVEHYNHTQHRRQPGQVVQQASSLPPVLITVVPPPRLPGLDKPSTLCLRIRDQGGGVSPAHMARIFSYAFSTAGRRGRADAGDGDAADADGGGPYAAQHIGGSAAVGADTNSSGSGGGSGGVSLFGELTGMGVQTGLGTIAGLGFGLPMSRLYAQYFGGSLDLFSLDSWGKRRLSFDFPC
jgi:26S proteasome regulatory subunit T1